MNFLKASARRLEQGILEQIGAASSSKDASFDHDVTRCKQVEESLAKLSSTIHAYMSSMKRSCEDTRELVTFIDFYAAADIRRQCRDTDEASMKFLDSLQSYLRVQNGIKSAVSASVEEFLTRKLLIPLGNLLREVPNVKRLLEVRREKLTDYDSYMRKLESLRLRADRSEDALNKAMRKANESAVALADSKHAVSALLDLLEQQRATLAQEATYVLLSSQVHFHTHVSDAVAPLLPQFPQCATFLAELAQLTHNSASKAMPHSLPLRDIVPAASSFRDAMRLARGSTLEGVKLQPEVVEAASFGALHAAILSPESKRAVSAASHQSEIASNTTGVAHAHIPGASEMDGSGGRPLMYVRVSHPVASTSSTPEAVSTPALPTDAKRPLPPLSRAKDTSRPVSLPVTRSDMVPSPSSAAKKFGVTLRKSSVASDSGRTQSASFSGGNNQLEGSTERALLDPDVVASSLAAVPTGSFARVEHNLAVHNADELPLLRGQILEIIQRSEDGWWTGRIVLDSGGTDTSSVGKSGVFPYNYVTILSDDDASKVVAQIATERRTANLRRLSSDSAPRSSISASPLPR